jgi:lipopolysaccharide assembly protein A
LATSYRESREFEASFIGEAVMRYFWFLIFLIFVAIIGVFAFENSDPVPINYLDQSLSVQSIHLPMSVLIGGIYVLGMLTGWTVVGFLKRTVQHVTERQKG